MVRAACLLFAIGDRSKWIKFDSKVEGGSNKRNAEEVVAFSKHLEQRSGTGSIAFASGSHLALQTRYRQKLGVSADSSKCSDCQTRTRKVALVADERRVEIYRKIQREYSVELRNLKPWSFDVPILRPGQIVVMHPMLWHQVQPNNSSSDRFAFYVLCMCVSLMVNI